MTLVLGDPFEVEMRLERPIRTALSLSRRVETDLRVAHPFRTALSTPKEN